MKYLPALIYHIRNKTAVGKKAIWDWVYAYKFARWGIFADKKAYQDHIKWWNNG